MKQFRIENYFFGNNKELENIVFSKANSKIRILNNQKAENVKITYTF